MKWIWTPSDFYFILSLLRILCWCSSNAAMIFLFKKLEIWRSKQNEKEKKNAQLTDMVIMLKPLFFEKKPITVDTHCIQSVKQTYPLAKSCRMGKPPDSPCSVIYRERVLPSARTPRRWKVVVCTRRTRNTRDGTRCFARVSPNRWRGYFVRIEHISCRTVCSWNNNKDQCNPI